MTDISRDLIEATLDEVLPRPDARPSELSEAMRYAVGIPYKTSFNKRWHRI